MRHKELDNLAIKFLDENWDEINPKEHSWNVKTKKEAISQIKKDPDLTGWVITELMNWGTRKNHLDDLKIENENNKLLIGCENKYFTLDDEDYFQFVEVFPKKIIIEKTVFKTSG